MATVKGGFLGDLSGSVGNVTFARARGGIRTARVRATPSNPRTAAQQSQRGRFKQIQQFASAFLAVGLVRAFWQGYATGGLSAYNAFIRANSAVMPDGLDPAAALISQGNGLAGVDLVTVLPSAAEENRFELTLGSPAGGDDDDLLVGLIYNGQTGEVVLVDAGARRSDGALEVLVPLAWAQNDADALFGYAFAYRIEGSALRLSASSTGKVTATAFVPPAADVPAAQGGQDVPFGQAAA